MPWRNVKKQVENTGFVSVFGIFYNFFLSEVCQKVVILLNLLKNPCFFRFTSEYYTILLKSTFWYPIHDYLIKNTNLPNKLLKCHRILLGFILTKIEFVNFFFQNAIGSCISDIRPWIKLFPFIIEVVATRYSVAESSCWGEIKYLIWG